MAKRGKSWNRRGFLNRMGSPDRGWYYFTIIRSSEREWFNAHENAHEKRYLSVEFQLADCNRTISLDFTPYEEFETRTVREKALRFRKILDEFFEELEDALSWMEEASDDEEEKD